MHKICLTALTDKLMHLSFVTFEEFPLTPPQSQLRLLMVPNGISKRSWVEKLFFDSECFNLPPRLFPDNTLGNFSLILSKKPPLDLPLRKQLMRNVLENSLDSPSFFSKQFFMPWKILLTESRASLYIALFKWQSKFLVGSKAFNFFSFDHIYFCFENLIFSQCYFIRLELLKMGPS